MQRGQFQVQVRGEKKLPVSKGDEGPKDCALHYSSRQPHAVHVKIKSYLRFRSSATFQVPTWFMATVSDSAA